MATTIDNCDQALAYWFDRTNYERSPLDPVDWKLDRMRALLRALGNPECNYRIIHVAGSKGKGSTAAMLSAVLQHAGYRTGLFTSPHLCRVEERIQVNSQPIGAEELTVRLNEVAVAEREIGASCSFFEIATALGFLHFARRRVELAVVEVGLGGRFDSTNVCKPIISLITSISLDHTRELGGRIAQIAMEKAGIVKQDRPTVSGAASEEASRVIAEICGARNSPLFQLGVDFNYHFQPGGFTAGGTARPRVQVQTKRRRWPALDLNLWGEHQAANAAVTMACVEQLQSLGLTIRDSAVASGLAEVVWPARLEVLQREPLVILDCAHNVASVQALVDTVSSSFAAASGNGQRQRRSLIFAASADKDLAGMLRILGTHFTDLLVTRFTSNSRCADPHEVAELARRHSTMRCAVTENASQAWQQAVDAAGPQDLICITGSVYLAGEMLSFWEARRGRNSG